MKKADINIVTKGIATSNKKLLVAPGITTRNKKLLVTRALLVTSSKDATNYTN